MALEIIQATYFTRAHLMDVTEAVKQKMDGGNLDIIASNDIAGDPHFGKKKRLAIRYLLNGKECEKTVLEGFRISIIDSIDDTIVHQPIVAVEMPKDETSEQAAIRKDAPTTHKIKDAMLRRLHLPVEKPEMTDIIIPTYNNEALTIACFESIKKCTKEGTYRIIWVDNGSKDFRKAKKAIQGINHLAVMLKKNTGFVGAINTGLAKSTAPTVCLLNNDTEVSPRWLEKMTDILYADPKMGIVGCLTGPPAIKRQYDSHHNIAYQQRAREIPVFPYYRNLIDFNERIEKELPRVTGHIDFVAFLCAVIKREVIEKVTAFHPSYAKGLDTKYDMGMWDDCDYGWAINQVGYKQCITLDTCIIHKGRSTFKVIQEKEGFDVDMLLNRNRHYMDKKRATIEHDLAKAKADSDNV